MTEYDVFSNLNELCRENSFTSSIINDNEEEYNLNEISFDNLTNPKKTEATSSKNEPIKITPQKQPKKSKKKTEVVSEKVNVSPNRVRRSTRLSCSSNSSLNSITQKSTSKTHNTQIKNLNKTPKPTKTTRKTKKTPNRRNSYITKDKQKKNNSRIPTPPGSPVLIGSPILIGSPPTPPERREEMQTLNTRKPRKTRNTKITDYIDLCAPQAKNKISIPEKITHKDNASDVEVVEESSFTDDNPELSLKVMWHEKFEIIKLRKYQKFIHLFEILAKKGECNIQDIICTSDKRFITVDETPDSINYKPYEFITARVSTQNLKDNIEGEINKKTKKNEVLLKVQSDKFKRPLQMHLLKSESFKILYIKCAEELKLNVNNIRLSFDGEELSSSDTPNTLELEGGEMFDLRII